MSRCTDRAALASAAAGWLLFLGNLGGAPLAGGLQERAAENPPPRYTDLQNFGWRGPVKSVRRTTRILASDPRKTPKLHIYSDNPWMVFDSAGFIIEQALHHDREGTVGRYQRTERDGYGRPLRYVELDNDGKKLDGPPKKTERRMGPHGPIEEKFFVGDKLQHSREVEYDGHGHERESRTYDGTGALIGQASSRYDEHGRLMEWRVSSPTAVHTHFRNHYTTPTKGGGSDMTGRDWLDASGNVIRSAIFREGRLLSYWQDPECRCEDHIGFAFAGDQSVTYYFEADGSLLTATEYHPGRRGNVELDAAELKDESGVLLEKVEIRYERDAFDNWVSRSVFILDMDTGQMVETQQDKRVITYY